MGQICSICGFKEKPQQATAHVETSLRDTQASHQSQPSSSSRSLFNIFTNRSNSANAPFFLYAEGAIVPEDVTHIRVDPSVAVIPYSAFAGLLQLKEVVLPEGLQEIGSAFQRCRSLERINFPSTVTAIGDNAFMNCTSLSEVDLSNVKTIGNCAFRGCTSLGRIHFPSTVTAIGYEAFVNCTSLREVELFGGIQDIRAAFRGCSSLKHIVIPSKAFVIETDARNCHLRFLTVGTITPTDYGQWVIASECLKSMSSTFIAEVANTINAIINSRERILERIRALFTYYELVEVTSILELALWKVTVDEFDDLNAREECRVMCGAGIIIPIVLPFL